MKISIFIKELEIALVERGVSEETAKKHVANLSRSFTSDDLSEIDAIKSHDEIAVLADSIALILNKKVAPSTQASVQIADTAPKAASNDIAKKQVEQVKNIDLSQKSNISSAPKPLYSEPEFEYVSNRREQNATSRGITIFWVVLLVTLPITLGILGLCLGAFVFAFGALIGLIIASIAILVALVAAGAAASLVGIIYGVTQLFSFPAAGIYEIGLGVMVAGAVLFFAVLIYNFAIRFLPWVISWLSVFFKYTLKKLVVLFKFARKECYKL